jgi:2-dehydropantoate 2-reductase
MKILVFGAGAIGTYIGGNLSLSGHSAFFIEQEQNIQHLLENGLSIQDENGVRKTKNILAAATIGEALKSGPFDAAILAVKSFDTDNLLASFLPYAGQIPPILCLQNGVENEGKIAKLLGTDRVIPGTVTSAIGRQGLGEITVERRRGIGITLGHPISESLISSLRQAGLNARGYRDGKSMKWSKMLSNLVANATSAIFNMTPREIYQNPDSYLIEHRMMRETLLVMDKQGIRVTDLPETPVASMAFAFRRLPQKLAQTFFIQGIGSGRGGKMPSFHIDLYRGAKRSEVEFLNGAVVRHAERLGLRTPVNQKLTETLVRMAASEIDLHAYDHQPGRFLEELSD